MITRRRLIGAGTLGASGLLLGGCDRIDASRGVQRALAIGNDATRLVQRAVTDRAALAPEYGGADLSPVFRVNGNGSVKSPDYARLLAGRFADWRLQVGGLVARPLSLSLQDIGRMPTRTQITRHDCVEGWSAIGQWTGVPLRLILQQAGLSARARYILFRCADDFGGTPYYETIDLIDAFHPQTILAWAMNGRMLAVGHGAPLRLRVERQLGYKQAKFVMGIEAIESFASIAGGKGGYWEDVAHYQWYAGI